MSGQKKYTFTYERCSMITRGGPTDCSAEKSALEGSSGVVSFLCNGIRNDGP